MAATLTTEQLAALQDFAYRHGRNWKSRLQAVWENGRYNWQDDAAALQTIRNTLGPSWLVRFRLPV